ncbi:hypothetical protein LACPH_002634 [Lacticaseibacillus parahuelsenbergensis]|uniref:Uncharacterized protein n=1 Tax=Lacticaseibacillus parahuelsenbergensis TaxID=3068305 RepID=A0ABY9L268_9LACO|nr:hypothetical protein [Lacticaseibacillus casei]MDE3283742.1 hypothetical protein [Lacticaseibacillus casei]WLV77854.1 hypothetical protein LACPH_002634 [Lacticaseibacillus sp. NCIMB 15471]
MIKGDEHVQPVTITNLDRLLTALIQARQRGELQQTVVERLPSEPGADHIFGTRTDKGEFKPLIRFRFDQQLPDNYAEALKQHGYQLEVLHEKH